MDQDCFCYAQEPAVIMGMIGIYKISLNSSKLGLSKEVLASKVIGTGKKTSTIYKNRYF